MSATVTITGAGVAGLTLALELANRGAQVAIWDRAGPPGPHGCSWWAGGMLAPYCEGVTAEPEVVRWGEEAADWWSAIGVPVTRHGTLVVAPPRDGAELTRFARRARHAQALDQAQLAALEPDLGDHFARALFVESEAHLDPRRALATLTDTLARHGVTVGTTPPERAATRILATGFAARDALPDLRGVKGEMLILH